MTKDELKNNLCIDLDKYTKEELFDKCLKSMLDIFNESNKNFHNLLDVHNEILKLYIIIVENLNSSNIENINILKQIDVLLNSLIEKYKDIFIIKKILINFIQDKDLQNNISVDFNY